MEQITKTSNHSIPCMPRGIQSADGCYGAYTTAQGAVNTLVLPSVDSDGKNMDHSYRQRGNI